VTIKKFIRFYTLIIKLRDIGKIYPYRIKYIVCVFEEIQWLISFIHAISGSEYAYTRHKLIGQAIMKLWLTVSNYKVRYYGDRLITRAITRVTFSLSLFFRVHSREWKCTSSWHAINPDPIANRNFAFIIRIAEFHWRAACVLFYSWND